MNRLDDRVEDSIITVEDREDDHQLMLLRDSWSYSMLALILRPPPSVFPCSGASSLAQSLKGQSFPDCVG